LWQGKSGEIAQLYQVGRLLIALGKLVEGVVEGQQIFAWLRSGYCVFRQLLAFSIAAMLGAFLAPRVFDQNTAHGLSGSAKEMAAAVPFLSRVRAQQPQVRLMDERR